MSGHSHWATIRRGKAAVDAKRGRIFSKCAKLIMSAARQGGGDPDSNIRLRYVIDDARAVNMPRESIERAILKGTGELEGGQLDEIVYEGYGPGGVALMVQVLTDNRNRTTPEIRRVFETTGGSVSRPGSVAWMFEKRGLLSIKRSAVDEDKLLEIVLDAGADDLRSYDEVYEILCEPGVFNVVRQALTKNNVATETAQVTYIAKRNVTPSPQEARRALQLMEALEEHDDVQNVSANFEISAELAAELK